MQTDRQTDRKADGWNKNYKYILINVLFKCLKIILNLELAIFPVSLGNKIKSNIRNQPQNP